LAEITTPVPTQPFPFTPVADVAAPPAAQVESSSAPARRTSWLRRLASAVADTHRAAVPF
jgi:hypothetical protein